MSMGTPASRSARTTPTWANPLAPPPANAIPTALPAMNLASLVEAHVVVHRDGAPVELARGLLRQSSAVRVNHDQLAPRSAYRGIGGKQIRLHQARLGVFGIDNQQDAVGLTDASSSPAGGRRVGLVDDEPVADLLSVEPGGQPQRLSLGGPRVRGAAEHRSKAMRIQRQHRAVTFERPSQSPGECLAVDVRTAEHERNVADLGYLFGGALHPAQPPHDQPGEIQRQLRVLARQLLEVFAGQAENDAVAHRVDARGPRLAGQKCHLADAFTPGDLAQDPRLGADFFRHGLQPAGHRYEQVVP
jgi:hypothetical protein